MKFALSTNIRNTEYSNFDYIVTSNARRVLGQMVNDYNTGIHSFILVGTYGTGKSSFLVALDRDMSTGSNLLFENKGQFNRYEKFRSIKVIGEYDTMQNILNRELVSDDSDAKLFFDRLDNTIKTHKKNGEFVLLIVDEFGKILEHAANNNPEKELFFLQQLAEFVNHPKRDNVILITTLHQGFGAYSRKLSEEQRNEWEKVKGRFKEIVFSEPVEQLLHLAANRLESDAKRKVESLSIDKTLSLAKDSNLIDKSFDKEVAKKLYPLDAVSAVILTQSIQRYGQNERSLFSFLSSKSEHSISQFKASKHETYNLAYIHDYIINNFYSYLSEANNDSTNWRAIRVALERVENLVDIKDIEDSIAVVKSIGLLNIFANASKFAEDSLIQYLTLAVNIKEPKRIIDNLVTLNVIRYARYRSQYIIFEGSDINIEDELFKAAGQLPKPIDIVDDLKQLFDYRIIQANASYYNTGTPRFFEFKLSDTPLALKPEKDTDGYINIVFPRDKAIKQSLIQESRQNKEAIIYVYFNETDELASSLYEIQKLEYVRDKVILDDRIAEREINSLISYERDRLNKLISKDLISESSKAEWYYKGKEVKIKSELDFNKRLSDICSDVYSLTPIIKNELFNKHKVNATISTARVVLTGLLNEDSLVAKEDLGFEDDKFPPEKTIYYTLVKNTGIHRKVNGVFTLTSPNNELIKDLWDASEAFFESSISQKRKLKDLIDVLSRPPFKLKQGFLDIWLPLYLIIKKQDYSLYDSQDRYIPSLNREVFDLIQKSPNNFTIKAFAIEGVKLEFFNHYRQLINLNGDEAIISQSSFQEVIRPFLALYNNLNQYTKTTNSFETPTTAKFRNVLAMAKDPEKTFFEDLPAVFGFKDKSLHDNEEFMLQYQDMIKHAVRELRSVYHNLINKIEDNLLEILGIEKENYKEYKPVVNKRFKKVKANLLSKKQKALLSRLVSEERDRVLWYESICYVILNKPLSDIKDNEIVTLVDTLRHQLHVLTQFIEVSDLTRANKDAEIYKFELVTNKGNLGSQSYVLQKNQKDKTEELENKINNILTGDSNLDVCTLLRILKRKVEND